MILNMSLLNDEYDIYIGNGSALYFNTLVKKVYDGKKVFVVTDQHVFDLYSKQLIHKLNDFELTFEVVSPGEKSKSFETYQQVVENLIDKGIKRGHLIIAFGGGVIGDLAGFVASSLYRGIKCIQIPTSLLSMVDASIGGKTGINTSKGKNLVGAFYQPKMVVVNTTFLKTLPEIEHINGMAEIIKSAFIGDKRLVTQLLDRSVSLDEMIKRTIEVKRRLVLLDEYDLNERMFLNFGHTFGHAIEKKSNFEIKHGFAVAAGMKIALLIGVKLGITSEYLLEQMIALLEKYGLNDIEINELDYIDDVFFDKKNINDSLNMIFITDLGVPVIRKVTKEELNGCFNQS